MDEIKIQGIELFAYHGVLKGEKELGQPFSVDCTVTTDTSLCEDSLDKTVNYAEVSCDIVSFCQNNSYNLIETLANDLAKHILLKFSQIQKICLTIHKPQAPIPIKFSDVNVTVKRGWATCYLAIGSNLGDREKNLDLVWQEIENDPQFQGICKSDYIETKPYGVLDQPNFLNGAIKVRTILTPFELLQFCHKIEKLCGRVRKRHWGERTLDVDILMYNDMVMFTDKLKIPHPEMYKRDFVLKPLAQIEPYLIHPVMKMNVTELLKILEDK